MTKRKKIFGLVTVLLTLTLLSTVAFGASTSPKIDSVEYKGKKKIEVEFKGHVEMQNPEVKVTDSSGKKYSASVVKKDEDDITFSVAGLKTGKSYRFEISGVRRAGTDQYTSVKGKIRIAAKTEVLAEHISYDKEDKEVTFEFQGKVRWKKAKVAIKDSKGRNMVKKIKEKDADEIEVSVKKLTPGKKYTYKISGVARKGSKKYRTVKGSFKP